MLMLVVLLKLLKVENKIPGITGLATNSALPAVENKIPNVSGLVKKTITYISDIEEKLLFLIMINTLLL